MIEEHVARLIAQHLMHRLPRRRFVERRVEQLSRSTRSRDSPSRGSRHRAPARRPCRRAASAAALRCTTMSRVTVLHSARCAVAHEHRLPGARGGRGDFGEPEIGRAAMPVARCGRDISVRRDQRQLAVERLLRGEDDAQGRALPRRHRRGEHGEPSLVLASGDRCLGLNFCVGFRLVLCRQSCGGDTKAPPAISAIAIAAAANLACSQQSNPRSIPPVVENTPKIGPQKRQIARP